MAKLVKISSSLNSYEFLFTLHGNFSGKRVNCLLCQYFECYLHFQFIIKKCAEKHKKTLKNKLKKNKLFLAIIKFINLKKTYAIFRVKFKFGVIIERKFDAVSVLQWNVQVGQQLFLLAWKNFQNNETKVPKMC